MRLWPDLICTFAGAVASSLGCPVSVVDSVGVFPVSPFDLSVTHQCWDE